MHIHYSFEPEDGDERQTRVTRWLVLDIAMPIAMRPLRRLHRLVDWCDIPYGVGEPGRTIERFRTPTAAYRLCCA